MPPPLIIRRHGAAVTASRQPFRDITPFHFRRLADICHTPMIRRRRHAVSCRFIFLQHHYTMPPYAATPFSHYLFDATDIAPPFRHDVIIIRRVSPPLMLCAIAAMITMRHFTDAILRRATIFQRQSGRHHDTPLRIAAAYITRCADFRRYLHYY